MAHLEIVPPAHKTAVGDLSSQDEDGIWRITSMNNQKIMLMYNDPLHWNSQLRDEFFRKVKHIFILDFGNVGQELLWVQ